MNQNDFRYMHSGKQISDLKKEDFSLLEPIYLQAPMERREKGKSSLKDSNKKRALLLLHGFMSTPAVYRYLIPQIKNYDALVCPALPGHAESIEAFAQTKAQDWILCASEECEALFKEYERVDILGLSLGALIALKLSLQFSFNHMFLLAPALKLQMNINQHLRLFYALDYLGFCELRGRAGNMVSKLHPEISYRRLPIPALIELFTLIREHDWIAPNCPVDLFLGAHDAVVASKQVESMFSDLPNANIHWLSNSAHVLPLDNDLDQIVSCINQYD